jgi:hypothetical protein
MGVSVYDFDDFREDVLWRVRHLNRRLADAGAIWPGVLILDESHGLSAEAFELSDGAYVTRLLARRIRKSGARRFCWVMPAWRSTENGREEVLLLVIGERNHVEVVFAPVVRRAGERPRLGRFNSGAFGRGSRRASGRYVDALLAALE